MHRVVGFRVASAGGVDGDGREEVMVSNYAASTSWHTVWVCKYTGTGVSEEHARKSSVRVSPRIRCTPNPFRHSTILQLLDFDPLIEHGVCIFDAAGRLVRRLEIEKNSSAVTWDGKDKHGNDVGSGVYFVKVNSWYPVPAEKLVLIR